MVAAFELQWPARWAAFWPTLFGLLPKSVQLIDIFLRILDTIDERIVDQDFVVDRQRSALIKDAMRERCVNDIVSTWYNILGAFHKQRPDIAQRCLQCMQNYIEWIDIQLVTSEQWVNLLFYLFATEALQEDACDCLFEIVSKRMEDPARKLKLLQRLNICGVLPTVLTGLVADLERDGEDYAEEQSGLKVTRLAMTVGMELLDIVEKAEAHTSHASATPESRAQAVKTAEEATNLLEVSLPSLFALFGVPHTAISTGVLDFVTQYVARLKREATLTERHNAHILALLGIVAQGIQYTDRYDFSKPCNDYEGQVAEHRKNLFTVFKNLCSKSPLGQQFVQRRMEEVLRCLHLPTCKWYQVEATLALLFTLGEGAASNNAFQDPVSPFLICMKALTASDVSRHPHPAVQIMFFENCERFHQFFPVCSDMLPVVLAAFLDSRGICSANEQVAYRAAYLFKNFVLQLKALVAPLMAQVYPALQAILARCAHEEAAEGHSAGLGVDEQLNLYETVGGLMGSEFLPYAKTLTYLEGTVAPLLQHMQMAVASGALAGTTEKACRMADVTGHQISFIAYVSKGFNTTSLPLEVPGPPKGERGDLSRVFMNVLGAVLAVFEAGKHHAPVRDKTLLFVHRMVDLLGEGMALYIPKIVLSLLDGSSVVETSKALRIPSQMVKKAKAGAIPCLSELFLPLVTRVFEQTGVEALKQQNSVISEEVRQHAELLRSYYHLLSSLLSSKCGEVLICDKNRPQLENVLRTVLQGCSTHPELDLAKQCFQILTEMVAEWHALDGFGKYVQAQVLPASFDALFRPHFDPRDAKANVVVLEVANLHKGMLQAYGPAFLQAMEAILAVMVRDPTARQQFLTQLKDAPAKAYKNCLRDLVHLRRREEGLK
eukprot:GGOE01040585.1.p1 GENE.GGOE01040585.1~~GGOE01040585.1.p1  ORF type:complete len:1012 (-),score=411.69 GGOE01040585.1:39-2705(-)